MIKCLLLFIFCLNCYSMPVIQVFRKSDNKLVAGDGGGYASFEKLKAKMLKKGIDIASDKYKVVNTSIESWNEKEKKKKKEVIKMLNDSNRPEWEKELLKRIYR